MCVCGVCVNLATNAMIGHFKIGDFVLPWLIEFNAICCVWVMVNYLVEFYRKMGGDA